MEELKLANFDSLDIYESTVEKNNSSPPILVIPGGPWISGAYLDSFTSQLSHEFHRPAGRVVLPNHEVSHGSAASLDFNTTVLAVAKGIQAYVNKFDKPPMILGHSFGSIILAAIVGQNLVPYENLVFISSPLSFSNSTKFTKRLQSLGRSKIPESNDAAFSEWWKVAIKAYFAEPPAAALLSKFQGPTFVEGNVLMTAGSPDLYRLYSNLSSRADVAAKSIFIEGDADPIGPDNNLTQLETMFVERLFTVPRAGHFPMIENSTVTFDYIQNQSARR